MNSLLKNRRAMNGAVLVMLVATMLMAAFVMTAGGCAVVPNGKPPTTQQLVDEVNIDVFTAVDGYCAVGATEQIRQARATRILTVAQEVKAAAQTDVDVSDLRAIVLRIVTAHSHLSPDEQVIVRFAANAIMNQVRRRLGIDSITLIPKEQATITRSMIASGADGAIQAAIQYQNKTP